MESLREILLSKNPVATLTLMDQNGTLGELEPTLAQLRMNIPKGYHHKDNLTHSIKVLANAIARETSGPDLILRTAALFHDIGKPATRKFGPKGVVTFDGHETIGARMVKKILRNHGYSREEINEVSTLVAFHMRSHGFTTEKWTDSGVRRLKTEVGNDTTFNRLVVVFYADITTANKQKEQFLHQMVDNLVEACDKVAAADARKALRPQLDGNQVMELFGLTPGKELGAIMRYLNTDEGIKLTKDEAIQEIINRFGLTLTR